MTRRITRYAWCAALVAAATASAQVPPDSTGSDSNSDKSLFAALLGSPGMLEIDSTSPQTEILARDYSAAEKPSPLALEHAAEIEDLPAGTAEREPQDSLVLADVVASVYRSYPDIIQAREQPSVAAGKLLSTYGAYDTKLSTFSYSEPTGFYRNYRNGIQLARQTWWGGYVSAGYRIGRGYYQPWYKERETNDGGEFKTLLVQPLLRGRAIDPQRVAVFQADLDRRTAPPIIQRVILDVSRDAIGQYWNWVAAGGVREAQQELLELAQTRGEQYEAGFAAGKFAEIDVILNKQLIAERASNLLEAEKKFRAAAFKLSLYLRDAEGRPLVPDAAWLPQRFPAIEPLPPRDFADDLAAALRQRPEPQILQYEITAVQLDRQLAENQMLPQFDLIAEASQDVGAPASPKNDKGPFELVVGFAGEVPIQRRKARGEIQSTSAKIIQTTEKLRLVTDKIAMELQTAYNTLTLSAEIVEQSNSALESAVETLDRYRFAFERGKVDLIYLNLLETKTNQTEIKLIEAQRSWFDALSELQIVMGLDPLDQAIGVSTMPPSPLPGPGHLPHSERVRPETMEEDWRRHQNGEAP